MYIEDNYISETLDFNRYTQKIEFAFLDWCPI